MAIGNVKLMYECFLKHSRMGTARMKLYQEIEDKRGVSMERNITSTKKKKALNYSSGLPSPEVAMS